MVLVLADRDVRQCVNMAEAIEAIESMCRDQAEGKALVAGRVNLALPNGWIRLMPGALISSRVLGYKEFHLTHVADAPSPTAHVRYAYHLFDYESGGLLAMMDADYITFMRTAAASGAAIKQLARKDAAVVGVIGSGAEARSHLEATVAVRPVRRAKVFSRQPSRRERFADEMSKRLNIEIAPVERVEAAIQGADILVVGTNTAGTGPALEAQSLKSTTCAGLHINSIGSTLPAQRELEPTCGRWPIALSSTRGGFSPKAETELRRPRRGLSTSTSSLNCTTSSPAAPPAAARPPKSRSISRLEPASRMWPSRMPFIAGRRHAGWAEPSRGFSRSRR